MNSNTSQLGNEINAILHDNGLSVPQMAKELRISKTHLYNIINGSSDPSKQLLNDIATKYNRQLIMLLVKK